MKLWGGRFREPIAPEFERLSASFAFDRRLAWAEAVGTRAHVQGLARAGVLSAEEAAALASACEQLAAEFAGAPPACQDDIEDVHTYIAQRLAAVAPEAAAKLQTGRSRNEQVALDLRLWLRSQRAPLVHALASLLAALAGFAGEHADIVIPGYTHLQRAQPVSLGHHTLAYAEMLLRDHGRLADAFTRLDAACPLGSGALAGTPYACEREAQARELGFAGVSQNSLDAVADRDFAVEIVFALALLGVHLSRWAEDWILYSSAEFGWLRLGDAYSTGSSLMPQKKNPDALELIRGKSARSLAHLQQLLVLLKSLPLAYNRDLQEDKEPVFDAVETSLAVLTMAAGVVKTTTVNPIAAKSAVQDPALLATDLADVLVAAGTPFHRAHQAVGRIIAAAQEQERDFRDFSEAELAAIAPGIRFDVAAIHALTPQASVARRSFTGGTAPAQVRHQAARVAQKIFGDTGE
ncbi:MAG: argininosuccinate lyase [Acidobacteria bacterium]|nr:MAG: argininosuccinate lyase [Acidobacteriota bacterium]